MYTNQILAQAASQPFYLSSSFLEKIATSLIVTIFSAAIGYYIAQRQAKYKNPLLSYSITGQSLLEFNREDIEQRIGKDIWILYGNKQETTRKQAEDLYLLACDLENIGTKVIKDEHVNFEVSLSQAEELVDIYFEPTKTRKFGLRDVVVNQGLGKIERQFFIHNFEKHKKLGFRFLIAREKADDEPPILFVSITKDSNVELLQGGKELEKASRSQEIIRLVVFSFMFIFFPPIFSVLPSPFSEVIPSALRLIFFVLALPLIGPFAEALSEIITSLTYDSGADQQITQNGKYNVNINTGSEISVGDIHKHNVLDEDNAGDNADDNIASDANKSDSNSKVSAEI